MLFVVLLNLIKDNKTFPTFDPSRLFLYYNEREIEGTVTFDSGASIRDGIKSINKQGLCEEKLWPYQIEYFTNKPNNNCYGEAKFHKGVRYKRLSKDLNCLKTCLSMGRPFIFGFAVYDSFEDPTIWDPKSDTMPIPNPNKETLLGGHAVVAVGYSNKRKAFIIRNSWGKEWGMDGYFLMPYKYMTSDACSDFWVLETVSDDEIIVENKEYKLTVERDSYMEVASKTLKDKQNDKQNDKQSDKQSDKQNDKKKDRKRDKKDKRKHRRKHRRNYKMRDDNDDNDSIERGSGDESEIKKILIEVPEKEEKASKCLIRDN